MAHCDICLNTIGGLLGGYNYNIKHQNVSVCAACATKMNSLLKGDSNAICYFTDLLPRITNPRLKAAIQETIDDLVSDQKGSTGNLISMEYAKKVIEEYYQSWPKSAIKRLLESFEHNDRETVSQYVSKIENYLSALKLFQATAGYSFSHHIIEEHLDTISTGVVQGTGMLTEFSAGFTDILGIRSGAYENNLESALSQALNQLKRKAVEIGGNALIGIHHSIASTGNNMLVVTIMGTAVKIKKMEDM